MHIDRIRIKNYKSFLDSGDIYIDKNLFSLIGQNNTGKSAVLDAIQCIFPSVKKSISVMDFHKGNEKDIGVEICFKGVTSTYLEEVIFGEKIQKQINKVEKLQMELGDRPTAAKINKLQKEHENIEKIRIECLDETLDKYKIVDENFTVKLVAKKGKNVTKKLYIDDEIELSEPDLKALLPQIKVIPAIRDPKNESTAGTNSYLKELIQMLDDEIQTNIEIDGKNISYRELNNVISKETKVRCESLGEKITNFYNQAIGNNEYKVIIDSDVNISKGTTYTTRIKDINTGVESDILNCGTGYQSMIILSILETYVEISSKTAKYILLIEEPEVYLHPTLQRKMIDTLMTISKTNQVIFTSHSPITVSKLSKQQIKLVKKSVGSAIVEDIDPKIVIEELGIKSDDILANKGIIFVEGKDDKKIFEILLNKIEEGLSNKLNVIDAGNCTDLKFYANAEILINNKFNIPTLIVRDADAKEPSIRREELINEIINNRNNEIDEEIKEKIWKSVRVLNQYSLESFFIDEKLLSEVSIDSDDIEKTLKCYECQYGHYTECLYNNEVNEKVISQWYQPKYFLEKFDDKFKANQIEAIEAHNLRYETQWRKFESCSECDQSDIECYLSSRKKINEYTKKLKLQKKDFMIECIVDKTIDELKETKLKYIIGILEEFIETID